MLAVTGVALAARSINGTSGPDRLNGTNGNDVIRGFGGNARLNGNLGADRLSSGPGNDGIVDGPFGDRSTDVIYADGGNDFINTDNRPNPKDVIYCGSGRDTLVAADPQDRQSGCEVIKAVRSGDAKGVQEKDLP